MVLGCGRADPARGDRHLIEDAARLEELAWQRQQLLAEVRQLVLDDVRARSPICWNVFD